MTQKCVRMYECELLVCLVAKHVLHVECVEEICEHLSALCCLSTKKCRKKVYSQGWKSFKIYVWNVVSSTVYDAQSDLFVPKSNCDLHSSIPYCVKVYSVKYSTEAKMSLCCKSPFSPCVYLCEYVPKKIFFCKKFHFFLKVLKKSWMYWTLTIWSIGAI